VIDQNEQDEAFDEDIERRGKLEQWQRSAEGSRRQKEFEQGKVVFEEAN
jgi:hypothetical protein